MNPNPADDDEIAEKLAVDTRKCLKIDGADATESLSDSTTSSLSGDERDPSAAEQQPLERKDDLVMLCKEEQKPAAAATDSGASSKPISSTSPFRSILKATSDEIPISKKACWLNLPKPDLSNIPRSASAPEARDVAQQRRRSSVVFDSIQVREYEQTLGDNPSVSYGPPITLDWKYEENDPMPLDDYEHYRAPRRSLRQLCMNYYTRRNLLMWSFGYTEAELDKATKQMEKAKRARAVTKYFLPIAKVEDFVTSAGRKAKRAVGGGKKGKRGGDEA